MGDWEVQLAADEAVREAVAAGKRRPSGRRRWRLERRRLKRRPRGGHRDAGRPSC